MRNAYLAMLGLAFLAGLAGCATTQVGSVTEAVGADSLYGTWYWVRPGLRGNTAVGGQLILNPDATYTFIAYDSGHTGSSQGRFSVYRVTGQNSLHPWLELEHRGQRVFQFSGRDTLLLREGDAGYAVAGSEVEVLVRAPLHQLPDKGQSYDEEPVAITTVQPQYPEVPRTAGIMGTVVLHVLVGEDGTTRKVEVIQSIVGLNDAAIDAVKKWTFRPAMKAGWPVAAWLEIPITFHL